MEHASSDFGRRKFTIVTYMKLQQPARLFKTISVLRDGSTDNWMVLCWSQDRVTVANLISSVMDMEHCIMEVRELCTKQSAIVLNTRY